MIASGALLIVAPTTEVDRIVAALNGQAIAATVIGEITDKSHGVNMLTADGPRSLPLFEQDELTKI